MLKRPEFSSPILGNVCQINISQPEGKELSTAKAEKAKGLYSFQSRGSVKKFPNIKTMIRKVDAPQIYKYRQWSEIRSACFVYRRTHF
jgi:hypothetical protein